MSTYLEQIRGFARGLEISEKLIERLDNAFQDTWGHLEEERDRRLDQAAVADMQEFLELTAGFRPHYQRRCNAALERALKRKINLEKQ